MMLEMLRCLMSQGHEDSIDKIMRVPANGSLYIIKQKKKAKTYGSGDSLVVTHLTTNPPVQGLCMRERTGSPVFPDLWLYVQITKIFYII